MLALKIVTFLTIGLLCVLVLFFMYMMCSKLARNYQSRIRDRYVKEIRENLDSLLAALGSGNDLLNEWGFVKRATGKKPHKETFLWALETIFLEYMEDPNVRPKLLKIAHALKFPEASLLSIVSGCRKANVHLSSVYFCMPILNASGSRRGNVYLPNNPAFDDSAYKLSAYNMRRGESVLAGIASGCRRAGLYQYEDAIPYMLSALEIMSSETQFQILAGLSRIGDIDAVVRAFGIIKQRVLINERAIFEIVDSFTGDKYKLHKRMLSFKTEYVAGIFIKAMTKDIAIALIDDLLPILENGNKEMKVAALKALGKTCDPRVGENLLRVLKDPAWEIRASAAKALGTCVYPEAGEALSLLLRDPEWWVRQNTTTALLSYPNCEEFFLKTIEAGDAYATQSIIHTLEGADKPQMLSRIKEAAAIKKQHGGAVKENSNNGHGLVV